MFNKFKEIVKNVIRCKFCEDVIESTPESYWRTCHCGKVSVDGGHEWLRRVFKGDRDSPNDSFEDLSLVKDYEGNIKRLSDL